VQPRGSCFQTPLQKILSTSTLPEEREGKGEGGKQVVVLTQEDRTLNGEFIGK